MSKGKVKTAYIRYSSHNQDKGVSVELQQEACIRTAGKPVIEYIDRARTGRTTAGRTALLQLLTDAELGKVSEIYVYKYDRLGRNIAQVATIIEQLEELDIPVISCTEGQDELGRNILLAVAQHYSKNLGERCRDGMAARFKQGAWLGGLPPLGFVTIKDDGGINRLTIDLTEAAVVKEVFTRYVEEGLGLRRLANMLNERGLRTRKGTLFSQTSTSKILRNELYLGRRTWGKRHHKLIRATGKHKIIATPDATIIDDCPELAIIDHDLWDRVQKRIGQRGHLGFYHLRGKVSPLTGLIHCGVCGNVCFSKRVHKVKGDKKTVRRYITCGQRLTHGRDVCDNSTYYREQPLIEAIQTRLWEVFGNLDDAVDDTLTETRKIITANTETLASLKARASTLQVEIDTLGARLADPAAKEAATRVILKQIGLRDAELQKINIKIAEVATDANDNSGKIERAVRQAFEEARESLSNIVTIEQLHEFFTQHVGPMILTADRRIEQGVSIPSPAPRRRPR